MARLFFLLSGEHETLPFSELRAILQTVNATYRERQVLPQLLGVEMDLDMFPAIVERVALTKVICQELFCCKAAFPEIAKAMLSTSTVDLLRANQTFAVRVQRVQGTSQHLSGMVLERKLGELILRRSKGVKVNLSCPEETFLGVITADSFVFGIKLAEIHPTPFMERRPRKRPFFHPSAIGGKLARCMVNLVKPKKGDVLLDPFCGTGGFLIEAGLLGCRVVGFDAKKEMVKGSKRNLDFFKVEYEGLGVGVAEQIPLNEVDCIVTDPPYGRSATTFGLTTEKLVKDLLDNSSSLLLKGQRLCLASPTTVELNMEGTGYKQVLSHLVYVHKSLTRRIHVLEKI